MKRGEEGEKRGAGEMSGAVRREGAGSFLS